MKYNSPRVTSLLAGLPRKLRARGTEPHTHRISFGCHVIDRAYASTDFTGGVGNMVN